MLHWSIAYINNLSQATSFARCFQENTVHTRTIEAPSELQKLYEDYPIAQNKNYPRLHISAVKVLSVRSSIHRNMRFSQIHQCRQRLPRRISQITIQSCRPVIGTIWKTTNGSVAKRYDKKSIKSSLKSLQAVDPLLLEYLDGLSSHIRFHQQCHNLYLLTICRISLLIDTLRTMLVFQSFFRGLPIVKTLLKFWRFQRNCERCRKTIALYLMKYHTSSRLGRNEFSREKKSKKKRFARSRKLRFHPAD